MASFAFLDRQMQACVEAKATSTSVPMRNYRNVGDGARGIWPRREEVILRAGANLG